MSSSDDSSDSGWDPSPSAKRKETKAKTGQNLKGDKKYYRQRFVDRWLDRFKPWLARDEVDADKPFCKACRCRLNCNKCHLQRHEKTTKHHSNLISYLDSKGMLPDMQNLGQRKERKSYIKKKSPKVTTKTEIDDSKFESVFMDIDFLDGKKERLEDSSAQETLHDFQYNQCENDGGNDDGENEASSSTPHIYDMNTIPLRKGNANSPLSVKVGKKDRKKLLLQIQKDKNELMSSFNELFSTASVDKKERNHVDLFFDSVSSSIKALPPKLVAESKMRVSQLVCEMELRAITESESNATGESSVLMSASLGNAYIINHGGATANGSNQVGSSQRDASYGGTD